MKRISPFLLFLFICVWANAQVLDCASSINVPQSKDQQEQASLITSGISQTNVHQGFYQNPRNGIVEIGAGTLSHEQYPIHAYSNYSYTQSIYLQSELGAADNITKIWYYFAGSSLSHSNNWTIYMGHTSKTQFSSNADWEPLANLTQVYSATFTDPGGSGWVLFDITDFAYDGIDNLVIAVDENSTDCNDYSDRFYCSSVSNNRSLSNSSNVTNPNPASPADAGEIKAVIPNIRLLFGALPTHDLGVTEITPSGVYGAATFTPTVKIQNFGTYFHSTYDITLVSTPAGYSHTVSNPAKITAGNSLVVNFPYWTPANGSYILTATVALTGDANNGNDVKTTGFDVFNLSPPIFEQHEFINEIGTHESGADVSMLESNQTRWGTTFMHVLNEWVADDFTIPVGEVWRIDGFNFFGYQATAVPGSSPFTGAFAKIYDGNPSAGGTVIHDFSTNIFISSFWTNSYRISNGEYANAVRPIHQIVCALPVPIQLTEGTYWISWSTKSPLSLGLWIPHLQLVGGNTTTGNAVNLNNGSWKSVLDVGPQGLPFDINGVVLGDSYSVTFTVTDGTDPIQGANIVVAALSVDDNTDASGQLVIADVYAGTYSYSVSATGYVPYDGTFVVVDQDITIPVVLVSTNIAEFDANISVVPNPSNGMINISADQNYQIEVLDLTGCVIQSVNMNNNNASIDITSESNGMYIIRFTNDNGTGTVKVVKE